MTADSTGPAHPGGFAGAPNVLARTEIIARGSGSYRAKWMIMGLVLIGYGLWSIRDGFYRYPAENKAAQEQGLDRLPHPGLDVPFNQAFGIILPPLGVAAALWALYNSRGRYRLTPDSTLHVPGHPPVPLDAIRTIDKSKWDRKGIAQLEYELPGAAKPARLTLDDYLYERKPTDTILDRIEAELLPPDPAPAPPHTPANDQIPSAS